MNMTLSKRGDYVMRSAISLARAFDTGVPRKIREVVADTEVPQTFASQILADLVRAGLAASRAGRDGGYRLSRPPAEISILEVIEAAEGPLHAERCALGEGPCRWDAVCPLHDTWAQATVVLRDLLATTSLAEVAERDAAIEAGTYDVPVDAHRSHPLAVTLTDGVQVELGAPDVDGALVWAGPRMGRILAAALEQVARGEGAHRPDRAEVTANPRRRLPAAEASLAPLGSHPRSETPDVSTRYLLAWQVAGPGPAGRFEGELSVIHLDAERSEVHVDGAWRPFPDGAAPLGTAELEGQARRMLRVFLRHLASFCEDRFLRRTAG